MWCQKNGQMGIQLLDWVENIVEKGELAHYKQFQSKFSFSHNVFKTCLLLMCQNEYLKSRGLTISNYKALATVKTFLRKENL